MQTIHRQVEPEDVHSIAQVHALLREAGRAMIDEQGLNHWATEYSVKQIISQCREGHVFAVQTKCSSELLATYQLAIDQSYMPAGMRSAILSKFATKPELTGKGIGAAVLDQILKDCSRLAVDNLHLDVYVESHGAIRFYERHGFRKIIRKPTRRFEVWEMSLNLSRPRSDFD